MTLSRQIAARLKRVSDDLLQRRVCADVDRASMLAVGIVETERQGMRVDLRRLVGECGMKRDKEREYVQVIA